MKIPCSSAVFSSKIGVKWLPKRRSLHVFYAFALALQVPRRMPQRGLGRLGRRGLHAQLDAMLQGMGHLVAREEHGLVPEQLHASPAQLTPF